MADEKNTTIDEDIFDPEEMFVTLELDDGTEECRIYTIFEIRGQNYIALIPQDESGQDNAEGLIYFYRYFEDEEGNPSLENIADDEEYEIVCDKFDELLDDEEFEQM